MAKVLVTCPPMLPCLRQFEAAFARHGFTITAAKVLQTLNESELISLVPRHVGWIIGDDPATSAVLEAGAAGSLRAAVKWGVGVDNVDIAAAKQHGVKFANTPGVFGAEVADLAMHYVTALSRETFRIDREVRCGHWFKPAGISLAKKVMALVGFGDIGRNIAGRAQAADMEVVVYDPAVANVVEALPYGLARWPQGLERCDFIVLACALTTENHHMVNTDLLTCIKPGVRLVNVSRGGLIDEIALAAALDSGRVHSAALDVFECEPLPATSPLRDFESCIFGSHNASNTVEAVERASLQAIEKLAKLLHT
jgi:D-3-phosphoglycerate dehydrogenase